MICSVCNGPLTKLAAGTDVGTLVLRHDLLLHADPTDQYRVRPHAPFVAAPVRKTTRKAAVKR